MSDTPPRQPITRLEILKSLLEIRQAVLRIMVNDFGDGIDHRPALPPEVSHSLEAIFADLGDLFQRLQQVLPEDLV